MPFTSKTFAQATILLIVVGVVTVFAILATAIWLADRSDTAADELIDALQVRGEAFRVLSLMQDAETGQRGYLLTQDESYLGPYEDAAKQIGINLNHLKTLSEARPQYREGANALAESIAQKFAELSSTVELTRAGRLAEALEVVRTDRGKAIMDAIRGATDGLITDSNSLVTENTAKLRRTAELLMWVLVAGGLVILGVVGGLAWVAWRYTRNLELARAEVMALNATLEARVRERTADVARANEEIQRFAYIVSHDLRSPLVNIMGFTSELAAGIAQARAVIDRLEADGEDAAAAEARAAVETDMPEALGFIRASTSKMDRLINAILKLSREGQRRLLPERVSMADILQAAAASVRHRLDETGTELRIDGPIPDIVTDRLSVEQIFGNLVDNAVKYLDPERPGTIVIGARETPMGIEYTVEDNGRGIAAEDQERIFDLFRRAGPQDRPGEGIGLSHVRALVRRLGGAIFLRSEPNVGTTFTVRLPRILYPVAEGE